VRFEWDPRKAQLNKRKHDVTFEEAAECFADSLAMILDDGDHPDRLVLIGQSLSRRLIVTVYAEKTGDLIRIISARKATRTERKKYEEGTSRTVAPSAASLREMPEVDFAKVRVRRNPYAAVIATEGMWLVHDGPSPSSLEDIPEVDFLHVRARRSRYASRENPEIVRVKKTRGRPRKGQESGPTPARSVRLPKPLWAALEEAAKAANTTVHALLRLAVTHLLETELSVAGSRASGRTMRQLAWRPPTQRHSKPASRRTTSPK
jgi:uncharacterized protein